MNLRPLKSSAKPALCSRGALSQARSGLGQVFSYLAMAAGVITILSSAALAQQFRDVSTEVGLIAEAKHSWGNPIWGDINNDGFLDLIVPTHGLIQSGGPFVYLNNAGNTLTDIRATSGITSDPEFHDWHGFSFGDYDGDGNLDPYISLGAKQGTLVKSDLLFRGRGMGRLKTLVNAQDSKPRLIVGAAVFGSITTTTASSTCS